MQENDIIIKGAKENNLKNLDLRIPRNKLVVVTGVSGSGKSSLVFDTLYAEGQRRFAESLSSYARQFLGRMSKPDVESIEGIPPAIAIEQKVNIRNPRSTVATTTEIYDYLRLIFARIGKTFSPISGRQVRCDSVSDIVAYISEPGFDSAYILAEIGWRKRTDKTEYCLDAIKKGFSRLYADGRLITIEDVLKMGENAPEEAMLLVDRVKLPASKTRLMDSVSSALKEGNGKVSVLKSGTGTEKKDFSDSFELDGMRFCKPDEYMFSFNSPLGACPVCGGLGKIIGISEDLVVPDKSKSLYDGAIACWRGDKMGWFKDHLVEVAQKYDIPVFEPYINLPQRVKDLIWNGDPPKPGCSYDDDPYRLVGINEFFEWVQTQRYKIQFRIMLSRFSGKTTCHECGGSRLRKDAMYVKVGGLTIAEVLSMNVSRALEFFRNLELSPYERNIVLEPVKEIISRLECLKDVGLAYLTLDRTCNTLSGGESQRINLVTSLGSSLVGSMYILDEPSIGLHPRDTEKLIAVLRRLRDLGNTIIVVEHDEEIIRAADMIVDMGPLAGIGGGEIVYKGLCSHKPTKAETEKSLTLQYIGGLRQRYERQKRQWNYSIRIEGAMEHNLKDINVCFPLNVLTVVTGVSGSGKSSLVGDILYPALYRMINEAGNKPGTFRALKGNVDRISRVEYVDQNPIGKSSRSNPATYLKIYDLIRKLLSDQQFAKINGFGPSHFSFNQDGGRCPECQGDGVVKIEMQFMADVEMVCEQCGGKRFKPEILEVFYNGKNVDDILNMSVEEAIEFFSKGKEPEAAEIVRRLGALVDVGLSYMKLGQSSSTLSGGESQRIKLAYFLSANLGKTGDRIMFIFDEPTTGLHFSDVEKLLKSFDVLLGSGHSIVVVEHNPDVIRSADWIIDLGPDAGDEGGQIVFEGTPEQLKKTGNTYTARFI